MIAGIIEAALSSCEMSNGCQVAPSPRSTVGTPSMSTPPTNTVDPNPTTESTRARGVETTFQVEPDPRRRVFVMSIAHTSPTPFHTVCTFTGAPGNGDHASPSKWYEEVSKNR